MNIIKPQKIFLNNQNFKIEHSKNLINYYDINKIEWSIFENEENSKINISDIQFEYCKFNNIIIQNEKVKNLTFKDVAFSNCNFSNTSFSESTFIRCEFNNCKITGCEFSENRLYNVSLINSNAKYINFSMASLEKVLFKNTSLKIAFLMK